MQVRGMLTKQALSFPWNWKERYFVYSAASGALRYYEPSSAPVSKARTEGAVPSVAAELRGTVQPLTAVLPLLTPLIEEIESRHADLVGGDATARQLSFSCMAAWLRAAIRSRYEPNQRPTRR